MDARFDGRTARRGMGVLVVGAFIALTLVVLMEVLWGDRGSTWDIVIVAACEVAVVVAAWLGWGRG